MSAAATAGGYLYACGRLRDRASDQERPQRKSVKAPAKIRVAVNSREDTPRRAPKIEYRRRRHWTIE